MKRFVFLAAIALSTSSLVARQTVDAPRSLTSADYARAEKLLDGIDRSPLSTTSHSSRRGCAATSASGTG